MIDTHKEILKTLRATGAGNCLPAYDAPAAVSREHRERPPLPGSWRL
jgi:hypothetical protein